MSDPRCHAPPAASLAFIFSLRRRCRPPCHASLAAGLASISSLRRHRPPSRRSSTRGTGRSTPRTRAPAPRAMAPIGTVSRVTSCCQTMKAKKELITMMALPVRALAGVARSRAPAAHPPLFARAARFCARLRVIKELPRVQRQRHEERLCEALRARRRCAALTALQRFHSRPAAPMCAPPPNRAATTTCTTTTSTPSSGRGSASATSSRATRISSTTTTWVWGRGGAHSGRATQPLPGHRLRPSPLQVIQNGDGNYGNGQACKTSSNEDATVVHDNSIYTPTGKVTECGMSLAAWQATGGDPGTTAAVTPADSVIIALARSALGM